MINTQIGCNKCGKPVSQPIQVPADFAINGWVECQSCFLAGPTTVDQVYMILFNRLLDKKELTCGPQKQLAIIDSLAREIVSLIENKRFM